MKALVNQAGRVLELQENEFPVHESLRWIDAPAGVGHEWEYRDGEFYPPPPPPPLTVQEQIDALEAQQSKPRRIREAVLGIDGGWMADIDAQIVALRGLL